MLGLFVLCFFFTNTLKSTSIPFDEGDPFEVVVFDAETNSPLPFVTVHNISRSFVGLTDKDGQITIDWLSPVDTLNFSLMTYATQRIAFTDLLNSNKRVYLHESVASLTTVVFTAPSKEKERIQEIPTPVEVITQEDLQTTNPQTTADMLSHSGNVYVQKSQMGGGSPVLRGFEANKVLLVVDGVRLNNAIYRNGHLQNSISIDNASLDRAEVIFGPAAVMYGSDALGGVMHFFTKKPKLALENLPQTFDGNAEFRVSTANFEKRFHVDFNYGRRKWASFTSFTASDFEDLRMGNRQHPDYPEFGSRFYYQTRQADKDSVLLNQNALIQKGTAYAQIDFVQKFLIQPNEQLKLDINFQYSTSSDVPRYDRLTETSIEIVDGEEVEQFRYAEWFYGPQTRFMASAKAEWTPNYRLFDRLSVQGAFQFVEEDRINRRLFDDWRSNQEEDVEVTGINVDLAKRISTRSKILYGFDATRNFVRSVAYRENMFTGTQVFDVVSRYPDGGSVMNLVGAYLNYRHRFNDKFKFIAGVRYSNIYLLSKFENKDFFPLPYEEIKLNTSSLNGSASLSWKGPKDLYIHAITGSAFRAPNVDDFGKVRAKGDFITVPNNSLVPEKTVYAEINMSKTFSNRIQIGASAFYTVLLDAIVRQNYDIVDVDGNFVDSVLMFNGDPYRAQSNVNSGVATIRGISANVKAKLHQNLSFQSGLNYTYGYDFSAEAPLSHIPPVYGQSTLKYKLKNWTASFVARYNGWKQIEDFAPDGADNQDASTVDGSPSWATYNVYGRYELNSSLSFSMALENIMDLRYRPFSSGLNAPGRNFIFTFRGKF